MKNPVRIAFVVLALGYSYFSHGQDLNALRASFSTRESTFTELSGIGYEAGCTRRDPSDVIKGEKSFKAVQLQGHHDPAIL